MNQETNFQYISTTRTGLKYGVYTGIASLLYSGILQVARLSEDQFLSSLSTVIMIAGIFYAIREYKQLNDGYISFGQCVGAGSVVSGIAGIISSTFVVIYMRFIEPNAIAEMLKQQRIALEKDGRFDDEQIEQTMTMMGSIMTPEILFVFGFLFTLILGVILSMILGAFMKKTPDTPFA